MITMIPRYKLEPHPDNPRKDLGDLTELAASIKKSGLLQNLTVVKSPAFPDKYRIIIGHRRFAASEIAGLMELPCIIEEMDAATQIATMLAENMQRNSLTITDQVSGVQCMMDLGEDAKAISDKTGLSTTTVRKRMKLGEFDINALASAEEKGATLFDFMEITKIEDKALQADCLKAAGTADFRNTLECSKSIEKSRKEQAQIQAKFDGFATRINYKDYERQFALVLISTYNFGYGASKEVVIPADADVAKYVYTLNNSYVCLYKDDPNAKKEGKPDWRARDERNAKLRAQEDELAKRFEKLRDDFVMSCNPKKDDTGTITAFAVFVLFHTGYLSTANASEFREAFDIAKSKDGFINDTDAEKIAEKPLRALLIAAYTKLKHLGGTDNFNCMSYNGMYKDNIEVRRIYDVLTALGYQMCTEETEWMNGRHECFLLEKEDNEQ